MKLKALVACMLGIFAFSAGAETKSLSCEFNLNYGKYIVIGDEQTIANNACRSRGWVGEAQILSNPEDCQPSALTFGWTMVKEISYYCTNTPANETPYNQN